MRLVFAGTPDVAVPTLRALADAHEIVTVVTRPDAPLGRKRVLTPSPVAVAAEELGLPTVKTARLDEAATAELIALNADLGVIVAYGGLVREPLLSAPTHGWINLHFSLLPKWRGAAPVQRALMAGDTEFGSTVFRLVPELDAGDVFATSTIDMPADATAQTAFALLAVDGADLVRGVVGSIEAGTAVAHAQVGEPTHAAKLTLADGLIDWTAPRATVFDRYRGVTPDPGAHTTIDGRRLKILSASVPEDAPTLPPGEVRVDRSGVFIGTGTKALAVTGVQPAGRGPMRAADWARGQRALERVGT